MFVTSFFFFEIFFFKWKKKQLLCLLLDFDEKTRICLYHDGSLLWERSF